MIGIEHYLSKLNGYISGLLWEMLDCYSKSDGSYDHTLYCISNGLWTSYSKRCHLFGLAWYKILCHLEIHGKWSLVYTAKHAEIALDFEKDFVSR